MLSALPGAAGAVLGLGAVLGAEAPSALRARLAWLGAAVAVAGLGPIALALGGRGDVLSLCERASQLAAGLVPLAVLLAVRALDRPRPRWQLHAVRLGSAVGAAGWLHEPTLAAGVVGGLALAVAGVALHALLAAPSAERRALAPTAAALAVTAAGQAAASAGLLLGEDLGGLPAAGALALFVLLRSGRLAGEPGRTDRTSLLPIVAACSVAFGVVTAGQMLATAFDGRPPEMLLQGLRWTSIPPLFGCLVPAVIGFLALHRGFGEPLRVLLGLWMLVFALFELDLALLTMVEDGLVAKRISQLDHRLFPFIVPLSLSVVDGLVGSSRWRRRVSALLYALAAGLALVSGTDLHLAEPTRYWFGWFVQGGPGVNLLGVAGMASGPVWAVTLHRAIGRAVNEGERRRLKKCRLSLLGTWALVAGNLVPSLGVPIYPPTNLAVVPVSVFASVVLRDDLLDLGRYLTRSVLRALVRIATAAGLVLLLAAAWGRGEGTPLAHALACVALAVAFGDPMRRWLVEVIGGRLGGRSPTLGAVEASSVLAFERRVGPLIRSAALDLLSSLGVDRVVISVRRRHGDEIAIARLGPNGPVAKLERRRFGKGVVDPGPARYWTLLVVGGKPLGRLGVGDRRDGTDLDDEDRQTLDALACRLAAHISLARVRERQRRSGLRDARSYRRRRPVLERLLADHEAALERFAARVRRGFGRVDGLLDELGPRLRRLSELEERAGAPAARLDEYRGSSALLREVSELLSGRGGALLGLLVTHEQGRTRAPRPCELGAFVRAAVEAIAESCARRRVRVMVSTLPGLVVSFEPRALAQALEGLLRGALEGARPGSTMRVVARRVGASPDLEVTVESDERQESPGFALVSELLAAGRARLEAAQPAGRDRRFVVAFQAAEAAEGETVGPERRAPRRSGPSGGAASDVARPESELDALVVTRDPAVAAAAVRALGAHGTVNVTDAMPRARGAMPDVVLVDASAPAEDLASLIDDPTRGRTAVVGLGRLGGDAAVPWPARPLELYTAVARAVELRRATDRSVGMAGDEEPPPIGPAQPSLRALRSRAEPPSPERRQVAMISFAVPGLDRLSGVLTATDLAELVQDLAEELGAASAARGVVVLEALPTRWLLMLGWPGAGSAPTAIADALSFLRPLLAGVETVARRAALRGLPLAIDAHAGVAAGSAVVGVVGDAVIAVGSALDESRLLCDASAAGEVLLSERVADVRAGGASGKVVTVTMGDRTLRAVRQRLEAL